MHKMKKFVCKRCEDCCIFKEEEEAPLVFYWEKERLEELALKRGSSLSFKEYLAVIESNGDRFTYIYKWIIDGKCVFLEGNRCTIHEEKPISCKMFPIIIEVPGNRMYLSLRCNWVRENAEQIDPSNFPQIFDEFKIAVKVMGMITEFLKIASENAWKVEIIR